MKSFLKYLSNPATLAKFWVVVSTTLVGAIAAGLIVGSAAAWITIVIGAVSSAGVFAVRNAKLPSEE
jgi:hypothetical protein